MGGVAGLVALSYAPGPVGDFLRAYARFIWSDPSAFLLSALIGIRLGLGPPK